MLFFNLGQLAGKQLVTNDEKQHYKQKKDLLKYFLIEYTFFIKV